MCPLPSIHSGRACRLVETEGAGMGGRGSRTAQQQCARTRGHPTFFTSSSGLILRFPPACHSSPGCFLSPSLSQVIFYLRRMGEVVGAEILAPLQALVPVVLGTAETACLGEVCTAGPLPLVSPSPSMRVVRQNDHAMARGVCPNDPSSTWCRRVWGVTCHWPIEQRAAEMGAPPPPPPQRMYDFSIAFSRCLFSSPASRLLFASDAVTAALRSGSLPRTPAARPRPGRRASVAPPARPCGYRPACWHGGPLRLGRTRPAVSGLHWGAHPNSRSLNWSAPQLSLSLSSSVCPSHASSTRLS